MAFESLTNETKDVNTVFHTLAEKYAVAIPSEWRIQTGNDFRTDSKTVQLYSGARLYSGAGCTENKEKCNYIPLFPWRYQRRFMELARLVVNQTVEDVVMCRFSCTVSSDEQMSFVLYREYDLLEWLNQSEIISVYAAITSGRFANIIVRLKNGCVCSVEVGTTLSPRATTDTIDRHELIGRRGTASDRVVDTQIPQNSIYLFREGTTQVWTDTDAELFGLSEDEINVVRAACDLAIRKGQGTFSEEEVIARHRHLCDWVDKTFESDRNEKNCVEKGERQ